MELKQPELKTVVAAISNIIVTVIRLVNIANPFVV